MSKSVRDKTRPVRPILPARRPSCLSKFVPPRLLQLPPPPRLAPQPRLSAAGEGVFTDHTDNPQGLFSEKVQRSGLALNLLAKLSPHRGLESGLGASRPLESLL